MQGNGYSLNFLWYLFHDVCKPKYYAILLKLIQYCMSINSQNRKKKNKKHGKVKKRKTSPEKVNK